MVFIPSSPSGAEILLPLCILPFLSSKSLHHLGNYVSVQHKNLRHTGICFGIEPEKTKDEG